MKWFLVTTALLFSLNSFGQIELKSINHTKELIQGKWDQFEYCVYEANYSKKDTSSSIIFYSNQIGNKVGYAIWENGTIKKEGFIAIYDSVKVRTSDKYTSDNFLFSGNNALIISFLDENKLCLLQDSFHGYAKRYQRDTSYIALPTTTINPTQVDKSRE
jgi:hypothetical protein